MIFKIIIKVLLACVFLQLFAGCGVNEYIEKYNQLKIAYDQLNVAFENYKKTKDAVLIEYEQLKQKYGELLEENGKFKKSIKDLNDSHKKEISTRDFNDFLKREKDAWSKLY